MPDLTPMVRITFFHHFFSAIGLTFAFFFLSSCESENDAAVLPFEHSFDFEQEIGRLEQENPIIKKTVAMANSSETITGTVKWKNEMAFFAGADINRPQFRDSYEIKTIDREKQRIVRYISKEEKLPVKSVEISYTDDRIESVHIQKEENNLFAHSYYNLWYYPSVKYRIVVRQSVPMLYEEGFEVVGIFVR